MSVVLEKDKIIITIPSHSPESQLKDIHSDLIFTMQNFDEHTPPKFYQVMILLEATIPDKNTFEQLNKEA
jgi:hypothetical protein